MPNGLPVTAGFDRPEKAAAVFERLGDCGHEGFWDAVLPKLLAAADPDRALASLERWLLAGEAAGARARVLLDSPALRHRLAVIMGASQALADSMIQNPELAMILGDADELNRYTGVDSLVAEGGELMKAARSFTHTLDRIRYLKQRTLLRIVWQDVSGSWEPERVWEALSALADATVQLAAGAVWRELSDEALPVAVIALGKHGSEELNYSSDIDLMFVAEPETEDMDAATRFCEKLTRALSGRMGRGALYRVDLRLRPLGSAGPLVQRCGAAVGYYKNYGEPWETLALIRARHCAGSRLAATQFLEGVREEVYRGARSDLFLEGLVKAKRRYERDVAIRGEADANLKLGPGGIRDIEFVVQLLQLLTGHAKPNLQGAPTMSAISQLEAADDLSGTEARDLSRAYRLLRQVEHRIQLLHDLQSHNLPADPRERRVLARLMGAENWTRLHAELRRVRAQVRTVLEDRVPTLAGAPGGPEDLPSELRLRPGSPEAKAAERLLSASDDPAAMRGEIERHPPTAERVALIACHAQRVVSEICFHSELWDVAFSEEVELKPEDETGVEDGMSARMEAAGANWEAALAHILRREWVVSALKEAYHRDARRTCERLTQVAEKALLMLLDRVGGEDLDVVALGRLGGRELLLSSDWDVMLLAKRPEEQRRAEGVGEDWIRAARRIALASSHLLLDTRLRPEGSSGLVVRSLAGFRTYSESAMETWERLAFTRARSLRGWPETEAAMRDATYGPPFGPREERELADMRYRIRTERVRPTEQDRDLKLGDGFLLDIEWICAVLKMRMGRDAPGSPGTESTLRELARLRIITAHERDDLLEASLLFSRLRNVLVLLELESDSVLPQNPAKLERIAASMRLPGANAVLREVEERRLAVHGTYCRLLEMNTQ
ncbi:MAG: hypothetical protein IH851_04255 [Armatimonadetes bacterium]|nr:hypothetical protein [Armatimonadota bacterium]